MTEVPMNREQILTMYTAVLKKLLVHDMRGKYGRFGEGSLTAVSEQILQEFGERWRVDLIWRDV